MTVEQRSINRGREKVVYQTVGRMCLGDWDNEMDAFGSGNQDLGSEKEVQTNITKSTFLHSMKTKTTAYTHTIHLRRLTVYSPKDKGVLLTILTFDRYR